MLDRSQPLLQQDRRTGRRPPIGSHRRRPRAAVSRSVGTARGRGAARASQLRRRAPLLRGHRLDVGLRRRVLAHRYHESLRLRRRLGRQLLGWRLHHRFGSTAPRCRHLPGDVERRRPIALIDPSPGLRPSGPGGTEAMMKGHVKQRGGRFYESIYEGLDPVTGRELRGWHPAGTTGQQPSGSRRLAKARRAVPTRPAADLRRVHRARLAAGQEAATHGDHLRRRRAEPAAPRHPRPRPHPAAATHPQPDQRAVRPVRAASADRPALAPK